MMVFKTVKICLWSHCGYSFSTNAWNCTTYKNIPHMHVRTHTHLERKTKHKGKTILHIHKQCIGRVLADKLSVLYTSGHRVWYMHSFQIVSKTHTCSCFLFVGQPRREQTFRLKIVKICIAARQVCVGKLHSEWA